MNSSHFSLGIASKDEKSMACVLGSRVPSQGLRSRSGGLAPGMCFKMGPCLDGFSGFKLGLSIPLFSGNGNGNCHFHAYEVMREPNRQTLDIWNSPNIEMILFNFIPLKQAPSNQPCHSKKWNV